MNILIDITNEPMCNCGDIAMLQVAMRRVRALWPDASITIVTAHPDRLALYVSDVKSVRDIGHKICYRRGSLFGRCARFAPGIENRLGKRYPKVASRLIAANHRNTEHSDDIRQYFFALQAADLVMIPGGTWVMDTFLASARLVMDTVEIAQRLKKPTVMVGQAMGPVEDAQLHATAKRILPHLSLLSVREKRVSLPFLRSIGVNGNQVVITGDDAIEMAYEIRRPNIGDSIGFNLRLATYAGLDAAHNRVLCSALSQVQERYSAPITPIPIQLEHVGNDISDTEAIVQILGGMGCSFASDSSLQQPIDVMRRVGCCRVVITGSYHGAVFALSQGIPAIGLANSAYYRDKFLGLADQFGVGCEVVRLDEVDLSSRLMSATEKLWNSAEDLRPGILAAAERQIDLGRRAYRRLCELV